jgi:hypothetical protein
VAAIASPAAANNVAAGLPTPFPNLFNIADLLKMMDPPVSLVVRVIGSADG